MDTVLITFTVCKHPECPCTWFVSLLNPPNPSSYYIEDCAVCGHKKQNHLYFYQVPAGVVIGEAPDTRRLSLGNAEVESNQSSSSNRKRITQLFTASSQHSIITEV